MQHLPWYAFLEIGNDEIDGEHKALFASLNRLIDADIAGDRDRVIAAVREVVAHTGAHFDHEEAYMRRIGWPADEFDRHKAIHDDMRAKAVQWQERVEKSWKPWHSGAVFVSVAEWLAIHVADEDTRLGRFVRTGKVPPRTVRKPLVHDPRVARLVNADGLRDHIEEEARRRAQT